MRVGIDILFSSDFSIGSVSVPRSFGSSSAEEVTENFQKSNQDYGEWFE